MEIYCTRPSCSRPINSFPDLDSGATLKTVQQKYCTACGMPLILSGRYLPQKLLGKGGFGTAFLARDRYTPTLRYCVVKQFQPAGNLTPDQLEIAQNLFEREAEALEELGNRHPQIPDLFAFFPLITPSLHPGEQEEFFYLVQEFVDGQDLEQEQAQKGRFSAEEGVEILTSMLKVLSFVHNNGTIHRDIKPSNIVRGRNGLLYLLDFGAVKQVASVAAAGQEQSTGIYSIGFAPPEQMAGNAVYPSTDLYALAVTCITLLTGKPTTDLYDSYNNSWNWEPYAQVTPPLSDVLNKMLQSTPNQRYASADEVLAALKQSQSSPLASQVASPPAAFSSGKSSGPSTSLQKPLAQAPPSPLAAPPPAAKVSPPPMSAKVSPPPMSIVEFLGGVAFTGFEGGLLAIALTSLLGTTVLGSGAWLFLLAGLIFLQLRRIIERLDLVIIAGVTLGAVLLFPPLRDVFSGNPSPIQMVLLLTIMASLTAVAITTLFRLIYRILSNLL
ncbi:MAG: serine/threonine-protein kinase [Leptolyngbyaceae cyanobacterium MO_188.B28]|nr:serine/threonine-protein kinase [Leptolyngbyaceae cyanobacterium MO_188.B28]